MSYRVFLTQDAVRDLEDIDEYLAASDSDAKAAFVVDKIEAALQRLSESPERGSRPRELLALGVGDYHQVFFKPYRIIYTIRGEAIYVLLIADGRRDMESLLQSRMLAV